MSSATNSILISAFPNVDTDLFDYIGSLLKDNRNDFTSTDRVYEAVGEMLQEVAGDSMNDNDIRKLCTELLDSLNCDDNTESDFHENRALSTPVCLANMSEPLEEKVDDISSIWLKQREYQSYVDHRKLEKAEAKLKQKQMKRDQTEKPVCMFVNKEAIAVQATNRREEKLEVKGSNRVKDFRIENFDVAFGDKTLLSGAELSLVYGRRFGMVGKNGVGKSTLLKMISSGQLKIPSHVSILHVEQEVVGDDTTAIDSVLECDVKRQQLLNEEKLLVAHMNSEICDDSHFGTRLQEVYTELQQIESDKAPARASVILAGLGFSSEMQLSPTKQFSGGWRMRIALARALFSKPDLLLLDEPTNMLDMKAIIWLESYLQSWESTILVVSHDRRFLDAVATDILHFHFQAIESYKGNYGNFIKTVSERLKHQQREYEAQQQYRAHIQVFIDRFRYNANRAALVQSKIKLLERLPQLKPVEKETKVVMKFQDPEPLQPPVLQLDEISFEYMPGTTVLKNVDLTANMESRICIVGDNGSGKTTLLKLLTAQLDPTKGIRQSHRNLVIGYFTQHHVDQLDMSVCSVEYLARKFPGRPVEEYRRQLGCFGITGDLALQNISTLSGGQKSRLAFSIMSMLNPHFLILDEPTNHLDVQTVEALGKALQNFKGGIILVSHDEQLIDMMCQELWVCKSGNVSIIAGGFTQYRKMVEVELAAY